MGGWSSAAAFGAFLGHGTQKCSPVQVGPKAGCRVSEQQPTPRYWFPAKSYGWGWGPPCTWEGWLVLVCFFSLLVLAGVSFVRSQNLPAFLVSVLGLNAVLIAICFWKGEPPEWRWGGK